MRILIADDHVLVRRGLKEVLADEFAKVSFGEAQTATEALQKVWKEKWDIVLLDLSMPGRSGLDILIELKEARPKLPVLVLSAYPEEAYAVRALKAGASGYITKQSAADELVAAMKKVLAGGRYVTAALAEKLATDLVTGGDKPPHEKLSDREFQVMKMLAGGSTVKEIGGQLSLSAKTVSTYRARILEKLGLQSNVEIARYALQHRLVE